MRRFFRCRPEFYYFWSSVKYFQFTFLLRSLLLYQSIKFKWSIKLCFFFFLNPFQVEWIISSSTVVDASSLQQTTVISTTLDLNRSSHSFISSFFVEVSYFNHFDPKLAFLLTLSDNRVKIKFCFDFNFSKQNNKYNDRSKFDEFHWRFNVQKRRLNEEKKHFS